MKLFKLKGTKNLKKLNIQCCPTLNDYFFEQWNALNKTKNTNNKGSIHGS